MITSFADGTKIAAEMGVVANATGFGVATRGMLGPRAERVEQAPERFDIDALLERPIVDYLLGAEPSFGVFVLGFEEDPLAARLHEVLQDGRRPGVHVLPAVPSRSARDGPVGGARRVCCTTRRSRRLGGPVTEVVALAKRDLRAGETLDGIGGFTVYGMLENVADGTAKSGCCRWA